MLAEAAKPDPHAVAVTKAIAARRDAKRAELDARKARTRVRTAIRSLVRLGWSQRAIAFALGISHQRVQQIGAMK